MPRNLDGSLVFSGEAEFARRLLEATKGCRPDMHEPAEQDVYAEVLSADGSLDNAGGDDIHSGEIIVSLIRDLDFAEEPTTGELLPVDTRTSNFNLATLIAFARVGAQTVLDEIEPVPPGMVRLNLRKGVARALETALRNAQTEEDR